MIRFSRPGRSTRASFGALLVVALLFGCAGGSATPNPSPTQPPLLIGDNKLITWEIVPGELVGTAGVYGAAKVFLDQAVA